MQDSLLGSVLRTSQTGLSPASQPQLSMAHPFSVQTVDYTTLAVLPAMRERGHGHIVNVASIGGVVGVPHLAPYSASKFAQVGLTQALHAELAAQSVNVTSIVPGLPITGSPSAPCMTPAAWRTPSLPTLEREAIMVTV
jgi:NAD(P)-dependent dehydrogenase (short-subunit alcohol dehydrogenase family)